MKGAIISEDLFADFCKANRIRCTPIPTSGSRTPDFEVFVRGTRIVCEIKQIDMNHEDRRELEQLSKGIPVSRYLPRRLREKLKSISGQLRPESESATPTVLVVYDNTPWKSYTKHSDIVQSMFGQLTFNVTDGADGEPVLSDPYFGKNKGMDACKNTSVSALGILDGVEGPFRLRLYHNPNARVRLEPSLFDGLAVDQPILPDTTETRL